MSVIRPGYRGRFAPSPTGPLHFGSIIAATPPEESEQFVALVEKAAALIETRGKEAFPEFRKKDSEWYNGTTYIFVNDMKGTSKVNPPSPEIEGTNNIDIQDANGKALIREMIEMLKTSESG